MIRVRTAAVAAAALAAVATAVITPVQVAHAAPAAKTRVSAKAIVKADLARVKKGERSYAANHRKAGKAFHGYAGDRIKLNRTRITVRSGEEISVSLGHEGAKRGFCIILEYAPFYADENSVKFAVYDSVLKKTSLSTDQVPVGGACYSHAEQQAYLKDIMHADINVAINAEKDYHRIYPKGGPGFSFTSDWRNPEATKVPEGMDDIDGPYEGNVVRVVVNPAAKGYCVTVTNKAAKVKAHSLHYSSTSHKTHQGVGGRDKSGACAPVK